jgi:hypothetical protein
MTSEEVSSEEMTSEEVSSEEMTSKEMSIKDQDDITFAIIQTTLQQCKESATRSFLFWEDDDKKVGLIIRILHHTFFYSMMIWYLYIHIWSPSFFSLILFYIIFLAACFVYFFSYAFDLDDMEQKWTGQSDSLLSNLLEIFHIPLTQCNGVIVLSATIIVLMLTFEIISRIRC